MIRNLEKVGYSGSRQGLGPPSCYVRSFGSAGARPRVERLLSVDGGFRLYGLEEGLGFGVQGVQILAFS